MSLPAPQPPRVDVSQAVKALGRLGPAVQKALADACTVGAQVVRGQIIKGMQGPKHGKVRRSKGSKAKHRASAPNEPPAVDLGTLVRSIQVVAAQPGPEAVAMVQQMDNLAPYGKWLEYGTRDGKIRPRPFVAPAVAAKEKQVVSIIIAAVTKAIEDEGTGGSNAPAPTP